MTTLTKDHKGWKRAWTELYIEVGDSTRPNRASIEGWEYLSSDDMTHKFHHPKLEAEHEVEVRENDFEPREPSQCNASYPVPATSMTISFMGSQKPDTVYLLSWEQCPEKAIEERVDENGWLHETCVKHKDHVKDSKQ